MKNILIIPLLIFAFLILTGIANAETPTADFSGFPLGGYLPLPVTFTDNSGGSPVSWFWDFGDGSNSTQQNPTHIYRNPGAYTVSLNATNSDGSNTSIMIDYISVDLGLPQPNFTYTPASGPLPLTVVFNSSNSTGLVSESYNWSFGDGSFSTEANPEHIYQNEGSYTVVLRITNAIGQNVTYKFNCINVSTSAQWAAQQTAGKLSQDSFNLLSALMILAIIGCIPCEWIARKNDWKYVYKFALTVFAALISSYLSLMLFTTDILNQYNGVTMRIPGLGYIYLVFCGVCWCTFALNLYDYYTTSKLDEAVDTFAIKRK